MRKEQPTGETCDHCGRNDIGSWRAGRAEVELEVLDPHDRYNVLSTRTMVVCDPKVANRPKCYNLITSYARTGHGPNCRICREENPPDKENTFEERLVGERSSRPAKPPGDAREVPYAQVVPLDVQLWAAGVHRGYNVPAAVVEALSRGLKAGWIIAEIAAAIGIKTGRARAIIRRYDLVHLCIPGRADMRKRLPVNLFDPEEFQERP